YTQCMPGKKNLTFTWVTDVEITEKNAFQIMRGGRARWKIENETFNTLKNQGYEFEHNYGHGHKNLSVNLAFLMMLAFLVDQSQLLTSKVVQIALQKNRSLSEFYRMIRSLFDVFLFENWLELYEALAYGFDSKITIKRRSNSS
ncbi:MAG: transposase, partial [Pseudomonadota bacterium]